MKTNVVNGLIELRFVVEKSHKSPMVDDNLCVANDIWQFRFCYIIEIYINVICSMSLCRKRELCLNQF